MNILLIDVDSTIPNLALMKISSFYKSQGHEVGFIVSDPDIIYASVIFTKNKHLTDGLRFYYPDSEIIIGGSGHSLESKLPDEIESQVPNYSLYPKSDYSLGYASRGCNRHCSFCIVPQKEGHFQRAQHPQQWHNYEFDKIVFLDNNILFDKEWFHSVVGFCIKEELKTWFTQGLDIRLLEREDALKLAELKQFKSLFFAWDNINDEGTILKKITLLKQADINLRSDVIFYVYMDSEADYDSAVYRCRTLKELGTNPFIMYNINQQRSKRTKELQRWANRKWAFWSCDISEYTRKAVP